MDHKEATRIQAAARYLLRDLSPSELEGFEEHFFGCAECAEDLRTGAIFAENARAVFHEQNRRPPSTSPAAPPQTGWDWWKWFRPSPGLAMAALALATFAGYQNAITIPRLKHDLSRDRTLRPMVAVTLHAARAQEEAVTVPAKDPSFALRFEMTPRPAYVFEIGPAGAKGAAQRIDAATERGSVVLSLPAAQFPAGRYKVIARSAGDNALLGEYRFTLNYK